MKHFRTALLIFLAVAAMVGCKKDEAQEREKLLQGRWENTSAKIFMPNGEVRSAIFREDRDLHGVP